MSQRVTEQLTDEFEELIGAASAEQSPAPAKRAAGSRKAGYFFRHLAIAFAIGMVLLVVTWIGLRLIYGPLG